MPPSTTNCAEALRRPNPAVRPIAYDVSRAETNHRLANSLQLLSALVSVQSRGVSDPTARAALETTQHQIAAIAGVHRLLYQSDDDGVVELAQYLRALSEVLQRSLSGDTGHRQVRVRAIGGEVDSEQAAAIGVIVTELVMNASKHAYAEDEAGGIDIRLHWPRPDIFWLMVADQGKGRPAVAGPSGLGSKIVELMVRRMGGEYHYVDSGQGTCFVMTCPASRA